MPLNSLFASTLLIGMLLLPFASNAAIYKCTGTDGKVTISDQPCATDQRGGAVNVAPSSGVAKTPGAATKPNATALSREECQALGRRFKVLFDEAMEGKVSAPENKRADDAVIAEFAAKCKAPAGANADKQNAEPNAAASKRIACDTKKERLADQRPKAATLSAQDKTALAALERDYALACN